MKRVERFNSKNRKKEANPWVNWIIVAVCAHVLLYVVLAKFFGIESVTLPFVFGTLFELLAIVTIIMTFSDSHV